MKNFLRDSDGLTLVEVLAAVAILSIVLIGFLNISSYNSKTNLTTDQRSQAMQIAENILNDTKSTIANTGNMPSNTSPATNVNGFSAFIQCISLGNTSSSNYNSSQFQGKQHISMQSIVYLNGKPQLLTVTVYWGG